MAEVTRVNGTGHADATLYETANVETWIITAGASPTAGIGGTLEAMAQEFNPMIMEADDTKIIMVLDGHHQDAASMARRASAIIAASTAAKPATLVGM